MSTDRWTFQEYIDFIRACFNMVRRPGEFLWTNSEFNSAIRQQVYAAGEPLSPEKESVVASIASEHARTLGWYIGGASSKMASLRGKIVIFANHMAFAMWKQGVTSPRKIQAVLIQVLLHERRHSYQPYALVQEQCKAAGKEYSTDASVHNSVLCEQDADNWATFQMIYQLAGYANKCDPKIVLEELVNVPQWVFMGDDD